MLPTVDSVHVKEGLALFTDYLRKQPIVTSITATWLRKVQEIETLLWSVITTRMIVNSPTGDVLQKLAKLVGQPVGSLSDADLLTAVKLRVLANKSAGLSNDIIKIAALLSPSWNYLDGLYDAFTVETYDVASPDIGQQILIAARPGASYGILEYSTWADGADFSPSSSYDASAGQLGLGSSYDATVGGLTVATRTL